MVVKNSCIYRTQCFNDKYKIKVIRFVRLHFEFRLRLKGVIRFFPLINLIFSVENLSRNIFGKKSNLITLFINQIFNQVQFL